MSPLRHPWPPSPWPRGWAGPSAPSNSSSYPPVPGRASAGAPRHRCSGPESPPGTCAPEPGTMNSIPGLAPRLEVPRSGLPPPSKPRGEGPAGRRGMDPQELEEGPGLMAPRLAMPRPWRREGTPGGFSPVFAGSLASQALMAGSWGRLLIPRERGGSPHGRGPPAALPQGVHPRGHESSSGDSFAGIEADTWARPHRTLRRRAERTGGAREGTASPPKRWTTGP